MERIKVQLDQTLLFAFFAFQQVDSMPYLVASNKRIGQLASLSTQKSERLELAVSLENVLTEVAKIAR